MFECLILVCLSKLNLQVLRDEWWYIPDKIMGEGSKHCESKGKTSWNIHPSCFLQISAMEEQPTPTWLFLFPEGTRLSPDKLKVTIDQIFFGTLNQGPLIFTVLSNILDFDQTSQAFAASRGLTLLHHHLVPRFLFNTNFWINPSLFTFLDAT